MPSSLINFHRPFYHTITVFLLNFHRVPNTLYLILSWAFTDASITLYLAISWKFIDFLTHYTYFSPELSSAYLIHDFFVSPELSPVFSITLCLLRTNMHSSLLNVHRPLLRPLSIFYMHWVNNAIDTAILTTTRKRSNNGNYVWRNISSEFLFALPTRIPLPIFSTSWRHIDAVHAIIYQHNVINDFLAMLFFWLTYYINRFDCYVH